MSSMDGGSLKERMEDLLLEFLRKVPKKWQKLIKMLWLHLLSIILKKEQNVKGKSYKFPVRLKCKRS